MQIQKGSTLWTKMIRFPLEIIANGFSWLIIFTTATHLRVPGIHGRDWISAGNRRGLGALQEVQVHVHVVSQVLQNDGSDASGPIAGRSKRCFMIFRSVSCRSGTSPTCDLCPHLVSPKSVVTRGLLCRAWKGTLPVIQVFCTSGAAGRL